MLIVLTGGTGLIGKALVQKLTEAGFRVNLLVRSPEKARREISRHCGIFLWNALSDLPPKGAFPQKKEDWGVIHLSGENIFRLPWTKAFKKALYRSRVAGTKNLVQTLSRLPFPPDFFLSASAVGIYGENKSAEETESLTPSKQNDETRNRLKGTDGQQQTPKISPSPQPKAPINFPIAKQKSSEQNNKAQQRAEENKAFKEKGSSGLFLQKVCRDWEKEALQAGAFSRTVIFRLGYVLSPKGGFLKTQLSLMDRKIYGFLKTKKPFWISWIHEEDVTGLFLWAARSNSVKGIYNAASPGPVTLKDFSLNLCRRRNFKPFLPPVPLSLLKFAGGEAAKNLFISHKVFPKRAESQGYVFQRPEIKGALDDLLKNR